MQLISGFVDTYLRLNAQENQNFQTQLSQLKPQEEEPIMQIVTSWMEQGIERGEVQQALKVFMRLLSKKFGTPLDRSLENQIRQLTLPQLEDLTEALLDFNGVEDLQEWLKARS